MTHYIAELSDDKDSGPKNLAAPFAFFLVSNSFEGFKHNWLDGKPIRRAWCEYWLKLGKKPIKSSLHSWCGLIETVRRGQRWWQGGKCRCDGFQERRLHLATLALSLTGRPEVGIGCPPVPRLAACCLEGQGHADRLLLRFILLAKCNQRLLVAATVRPACVTVPAGKWVLLSSGQLSTHSCQRLAQMTNPNDIPRHLVSQLSQRVGMRKGWGTQDQGPAWQDSFSRPTNESSGLSPRDCLAPQASIAELYRL